MNDHIFLKQFSHIDGLIVLALVDCYDGSVLGSIGDDDLNIDIFALEGSAIFKHQKKLIKQLNKTDYVEGILISMKNQYHIIHPLESNHSLFLYVILDRDHSNLAYAHHEIQRLERHLNFYAY
ncbi:MAG: roadblock/LC7 domain-containing protein [Acinetobacter tjernbergiae]